MVYLNAYADYDYIQIGSHNEDNEEEAHQGNETQRDSQRRSALHELCRQISKFDDNIHETVDNSSETDEKNEIYELARIILRASHRSINRKNWTTAIHSGSAETSILELYEGEQTPLHILCANTVDMGMVNVFHESIADPRERRRATILPPYLVHLLQKQNRQGCTPLHYLAENRSCPIESLDRILYLAQQSRPNWLQIDVGEEDTDTCWSSSSSQQQSTINTAMFVEDDDGENPMHWALDCPVSPGHFRKLLSHGGKAPLWRTNIYGEFPMDLYAKSCEEDLHVADDESDINEHNYRTFEQYLSVVDEFCQVGAGRGLVCETSHDYKKEMLPLHVMASSVGFPCPPSLFELALRYKTSDLTRHDNTPQGLLPIHLALSAPRLQDNNFGKEDTNCNLKHASFNNETLVFKILEHHSAGARFSSREGRLALHYAAESGLSLLVIEKLLTLFPEALSKADPVTGLMPCLLAAVQDNNSLDVVFLLIRTCPSNII